MIFQIALVLFLLVANGLFAMTEIAIVSSRKGLLQVMASKGNKGAAIALKLSECPNRFLSTVQIGITLVGIVAGAIGSGAVATRLAEILVVVPMIGEYAKPLSFMIVISVLTYLSLVVGELVPKRLAMSHPEAIACAMSAPMAWLSTVTSPFVSLLSFSTSALLKLFGIRETEDSAMSREELTVLVRQGMTAGSINPMESRMMHGVIGFEKLVTYDMMIPRSKIDWIEKDASHEEVLPIILGSIHPIFPIYQSRRENLVGVVSLKEIYSQLAKGKKLSLGEIMHPPLLVPESQKASVLLETFRSSGQRAAFVLDEFGSVTGMVTLIDLMETIVGDVPSREEQLKRPIKQREDGSWLIDGLFEIEKLAEHLDGFVMPEGGGDDFQTVSGWFMSELGRVPEEMDQIQNGEWQFEVMDLDNTRVDKVLALRISKHGAEGNEQET